VAEDYLARPGLALSGAFEWRKKYKEILISEDLWEATLDTWYEKPNYGLLTSDFRPCVLLTDDTDASIKYFSGFSEDISAACFVTDAFSDMRSKYLAAVRDTQVKMPPFLGSLEPVRGFESFDKKYDDYLNFARKKLLEVIDHEKVIDFTDFFDEVVRVSEDFLKVYPITRSGFLLSDYCSTYVSGLYISLYEGNPEIDYQKSKLVQSIGFYCYMEYANEHGFFVDRNQPWRLIADVESDPMREYIRKYSRETDPGNTLEYLFRTKTEFDDIYFLRNFIVSVFLSLRDENPITTYSFLNKQTMSYIQKRIFKKSIRAIDSLDERFWLSLLLRVRMREIGIDKNLFSSYNEDMKLYYNQSRLLAAQTGGSTINATLAWVGKLCSDHIRAIYQERQSRVVSTGPVLLGDYYNFEQSGDSTSPAISRFDRPVSGITTTVSGHNHRYDVDESGNGFTEEAIHPENPNIRHRHKVVNWVVNDAQSGCYPGCNQGVGPHIHRISE